MHQRKPFLHRTSNLKKRICAQRQTERGGATTDSQCAKKLLHNVQQSHSFYIFGYVLYFNIFIFFIFSYFFYATNKEEVCNYCFTMCKKNNAQCATTSFFSSQPQAVTTINPNLQLPPILLSPHPSVKANIPTIVRVK